MTTRRIRIGERFNNLLIIDEIKTPSKDCIAVCKCDCGTIKKINRASVVMGKTRSCGCLASVATRFKPTHGKSRTKIYRIWRGMRNRCLNKNADQYKYYGDRGISVCDSWRDFKNFYRDMGDVPKSLSLDRINNNGNYCKENCKWSTRSEQQRNKTNNITLTYNGETKLAIEWAEQLGIRQETLKSRINLGWSDLDVLTRTVKHKVNYKPKI